MNNELTFDYLMMRKRMYNERPMERFMELRSPKTGYEGKGQGRSPIAPSKLDGGREEGPTKIDIERSMRQGKNQDRTKL